VLASVGLDPTRIVLLASAPFLVFIDRGRVRYDTGHKIIASDFKPCLCRWSIGQQTSIVPHLQLSSVLPPPFSSSPLLVLFCCPHLLFHRSASFPGVVLWSSSSHLFWPCGIHRNVYLLDNAVREREIRILART